MYHWELRAIVSGQYLEDNNLKVISQERQHIKYGDAAVYTGVITKDNTSNMGMLLYTQG